VRMRTTGNGPGRRVRRTTGRKSMTALRWSTRLCRPSLFHRRSTSCFQRRGSHVVTVQELGLEFVDCSLLPLDHFTELLVFRNKSLVFRNKSLVHQNKLLMLQNKLLMLQCKPRISFLLFITPLPGTKTLSCDFVVAVVVHGGYRSGAACRHKSIVRRANFLAGLSTGAPAMLRSHF
jgi:hypothetical protein